MIYRQTQVSFSIFHLFLYLLRFFVCFSCNRGAEICNSTTASSKILDLCNGNRQCNLTASRQEFGIPCLNDNPYLSISYKCVAEELGSL